MASLQSLYFTAYSAFIKLIEKLSSTFAKSVAGNGSISVWGRDVRGQLQIDTLTQKDIQTIREFALTIGQGLQLADYNYEIKRKIIDLLDVQVILIVENNEQVVHAKCRISDTTMTITSKTTGGSPAEQEQLTLL